MTKTESLYFDLTRVAAAMLVLVGHVVQAMPGALPLQDWGHLAVVSFFVLSGYVISFVSTTKETSGREYIISRAARIYSVALPAIALTVLCDFLGRHAVGHMIYNQMPSSWPVARIAASLAFINENWFQSITLFSNGPYWSLCYEVWYYAIFGAAIYLQGTARKITVATLLVLAGPKILLLFPIWLVGVGLHRYKRVISLPYGAALFGLTLAGILALAQSDLFWDIHKALLAILGPKIFAQLEFSAYFPFDYLLTMLIAANFLAVRSFDGHIQYPQWLQAGIRWSAASTFSLYLFHRPLMILIVSVFPALGGFWGACAVIVLTSGMCILLSYVTERKKAFWKRAVSACLTVVRTPPAIDLTAKHESLAG